MILKQIQIDLPRTNPKMPLFQQIGVQQILERILYIWAIRHPASVCNMAGEGRVVRRRE